MLECIKEESELSVILPFCPLAEPALLWESAESSFPMALKNK